jgi:hypothetical protein
VSNEEIERFVEYIATTVERNPGLIGDLITRIDMLMAHAHPTDAYTHGLTTGSTQS